MNRIQKVKLASWIAVIGNAMLAVLKITVGLLAGSLAVVSDGIDSTTDIIISTITLFTASVMEKPPDSDHPYGHGRAESVATMVLSFVILFVGAQLLYSSILKLIRHQEVVIPQTMAVYVTIFSIAGKIALSLLLFKAGKKTDSHMLIANGKNMLADIFISAGVLAGLLGAIFLKIALIDLIIAIGVSIWIIKTAISIFLEISTELMEGMKDPELYQKIFDAVKTVQGAYNPHRTRVRKLSNLYVIDIDIEVDGSLSVKESHRIAMEVEDVIKQGIDNVYDIVVHIEPLGNIEHEEKYGLSEG